MDIQEIIDTALRAVCEKRKTGFDESVDFKLAAEAYRIHLSHVYDPLSVATVGRIDVVPHQVTAVSRMLHMDQIRLLLADDVGLGKTVTVGLLIKELLLRELIKRVLIVVPSSLVVQWQRELKEKFGEEFEIVKGLPDTFHTCDKVITSMDYAKLPDKISALSNVRWDVVIIDEAHHLTPGTQRYTLGAVLASRTTHLILVTATPHDGKVATFASRLALLHPANELPLDHVMIRRLKEDVTDFQGKKLFQKRCPPKTVEIHFNEEEMKFYRYAEAYIRKYYSKAIKLRNGGAELALIVLQRRIASSVKAGLLSLKKRLDYLGAPVQETIEELLSMYYTEWNEEKARWIESRIIGLTPSQGDELKKEIQELCHIIECAESIKEDSKVSRLKALIAEQYAMHPEDKIIVFTEYKDTLHHIYNELSAYYAVTYIHGELSIKQKVRKEKEFLNTFILVTTDAAGEGLNLQCANIVINYELPWNPNRMEQRIGRVYRYGQTKPVHVYNFMASNTIEGEKVLATLMQKIEEIRTVLGDHAVDVIGSIVSEADIQKIMRKALVNPDEAQEYVTTYVEAQKDMVKEVEQFFSQRTFDVPGVDRQRSVTERDIEQFLLTAAPRFGNTVEKRGNIYYIDFVPGDQPLCSVSYPLETLRFLGTFDKTILSDSVQYVALGHPVMRAALKKAIELTPVSLCRGGPPGLQIVCVVTFYDKENVIVHEEPVLLSLHNGSCQIIPLSSVWDLQAGKGTIHCLNTVNHCTIYEQINKIQEHVQKKVDNNISRREELLSREYNGKIQKKKKEMKKYQDSGFTYLVNPLKNRISNLKKEFKRKSALLERKKEVTWDMYGPVATALVLPERGIHSNEEMKKRVELSGMETVLAYERDHNRVPRDVSQHFCGYDVESVGESCTRYIEVKSFKKSGVITITEHEWRTAEKLQHTYFLYIVENALDNPVLTIVRDPYNTLAHIAERVLKESFEIKIKHLPGEVTSILQQ